MGAVEGGGGRGPKVTGRDMIGNERREIKGSKAIWVGFEGQNAEAQWQAVEECEECMCKPLKGGV